MLLSPLLSLKCQMFKSYSLYFSLTSFQTISILQSHTVVSLLLLTQMLTVLTLVGLSTRLGYYQHTTKMLSYLTYHVSLGSCLSDKELCQSSLTSPLGLVLLVCFTGSMLFYVCQTTVADQKLTFAYCTVRLELIFSNTVYPFKVPFPLFSVFCFSFSFLSFWPGEPFLLVFLV